MGGFQKLRSLLNSYLHIDHLHSWLHVFAKECGSTVMIDDLALQLRPAICPLQIIGSAMREELRPGWTRTSNVF